MITYYEEGAEQLYFSCDYWEDVEGEMQRIWQRIKWQELLEVKINYFESQQRWFCRVRWRNG